MGFVKRHFRTAGVDPIKRPDWDTQLQRQLNRAAVPQALPFGPWLLHQRPQMLYRVGPGLPPLECTHTVASLTSVDASTRGEVTLEWSAPEHGLHVLVDYTLQRRTAEGPWTDLMNLDPAAPTVVDKALTPDTAYSYRVVSTARLDSDDPLVIAHNVSDLPKGVPASLQSEASASKTTLANTVFQLNSVQPGDPIRRIKGKAQIYVYRWNPERAKFDRRLFPVRIGDTVGSGAFRTDAILRAVSIVRRPVAGSTYTKPVGLVTLETPKGQRVLDDQTSALGE